MKKNTLFDIIKENELGALGSLSRKDINDIVDRLIKKLDSLDMSLDMIYGSLSGADPLSTAAKQRAFGRLARPKQMYKVTSEAQLNDLIKREITNTLEEARLNKAQLDRQLELHTKEVDKLVRAIEAEEDPKRKKQLAKKLKKADEREGKIFQLVKKMDRQLEPAEKKDLYSRLKNSDSKIANTLGAAAKTIWPKWAAMYGKGESDSESLSPTDTKRKKNQEEYEKRRAAALAKRKTDFSKDPETPEEAAPEETPGEEATPEKPSKTDAPVSLFKGQGALYQRLYSSLAAAVGAQSKRDKNDVEQVVKFIMKDLSAQLRHNKIKVQENQLIEALTQALAEMVRTPAAAAQSVEAYKEKFKEIEKLRKKHKDDPKKLRTLDMDEEAMKSAYAEFKKSYKAGGAATDITSKSQRRVTPEKGVLQVGKAAGGKLKGWKGGVLDQETITKLIVKNLKPFIAKALKARGREDIRIQENKELDSIIEAIINEMQSTQ